MRLAILIFAIYCSYPVAAQVNESRLLNHLKILSADDMKGRGFGDNLKAQEYITTQFKDLKLTPAFETGYLQPFTHKGKKGNNIVAKLDGTTDEIIVVTAHFDHLGVKDGEIFNGADDNASGTAALFAIAKYFKANKPKHTLILAAADAEEIGSIGAQYLLDHFPGPIKNILLNINLDMISHNDDNELYACGTYFYPQLKAPLEGLATDINLKFGHDSPAYKGADNWTYASDHRVFHRKEIPFVYFGVEDHPDYHQASDVYASINPSFYIKTVNLIIKAIEAYDTSEVLK